MSDIDGQLLDKNQTEICINRKKNQIEMYNSNLQNS